MIDYAPAALDDIERLHAWLATRSSQAATRFLALLNHAEQNIAAQPNGYPLAGDGVIRKCLLSLGRSVYVIYYVIDDENQIILRLWHGREQRT